MRALDSGSANDAATPTDLDSGSARDAAATLDDDAGAGTGAAGSTAGMDAASVDRHCLDGIANYTTDGPFKYVTARSDRINEWIPIVPTGCKVPIVHFANGTGATCENYEPVLQRLATHGFLVACYENTATGAGTQCITAVETVLAEHADLADLKVGFSGAEQGGGAAFLCVLHAEEKWGNSMIYAGHAVAPQHGLGEDRANYRSLYALIESPMFMFNGSADALVPADWIAQGYNALTSERYWYEAQGAASIPVPTRWAEESAVVWFRWKLLGDEAAGAYFKNMPNTDDWDLQQFDPG